MSAMLRTTFQRAQGALASHTKSSSLSSARGFAAESAKASEEGGMKVENLKDFMTYFGEYVKPWALVPLTVSILQKEERNFSLNALPVCPCVPSSLSIYSVYSCL